MEWNKKSMKKPPTGGGFEDWSIGYRYPLCFMLGCG